MVTAVSDMYGFVTEKKTAMMDLMRIIVAVCFNLIFNFVKPCVSCDQQNRVSDQTFKKSWTQVRWDHWKRIPLEIFRALSVARQRFHIMVPIDHHLFL